MKTLDLTAEQLEKGCPFCGAAILIFDPVHSVAIESHCRWWECGTNARADNIARQSLECRIDELGEWVGRLADEVTELRGAGKELG